MEKKNIYMGGNLITLTGPVLKVGDEAPDFTVLDNQLLPKSLADFFGKIKLISVVPSLDTRICDLQTRRFNAEASRLSEEVAILTISMDLPFAQARWCGAAEVDKVITLSDHRYASFGENYGVLIEELRLLSRSIFIIDKKNIIRYIQLVEENHNPPDYEDALKALKKIK